MSGQQSALGIRCCRCMSFGSKVYPPPTEQACIASDAISDSGICEHQVRRLCTCHQCSHPAMGNCCGSESNVSLSAPAGTGAHKHAAISSTMQSFVGCNCYYLLVGPFSSWNQQLLPARPKQLLIPAPRLTLFPDSTHTAYSHATTADACV